MIPLPLVYAPNTIFRQIAQKVDIVNDHIRSIVDSMLATMYFEHAVGLGANMVGILKRIAVIDIQENGKRTPLVLINPEITYYSEEQQSFKESSICFPGIEAQILRPKKIKVTYLDYDGNSQELTAEGFLSTVIQHEVDYLDGKIFLDYLSKLKSDMLLKKMQKYIKLHPPHVHDKHCQH